MTPDERAQRAMEIFEKLLDATPDKQQEIWQEEVGDDALLKQAVEALQQGKDEADSERFLEQPAIIPPTAIAHEGRTVGAYRIIREIAQGGMGTVYEAVHVRLERKVALKIPHQSHEHLAMRLEREGQALARLSHPHIVQVLDAHVTPENVPFIAMAYIEGRSLSEVIEAENVSTEKVALWGRQIAEALDYLHAANIYHRDIKSSNIMIDRRGNAILTDFGIAHIGDLTRITIQNPGTIAYMCPEQLAGKKVDGRCDIYSLGLVLFEALTRKSPTEFEFNSIPRSTSAHRQLSKVIRRCVEKNPAARFQSGAELAAALELPVEKKEGKRYVGIAVASVLAGILISVFVMMWPSETQTIAEQPTRSLEPQESLAQPTAPPIIEQLIEQGGSLNILGAQLRVLQDQGHLIMGARNDFLDPENCYVFVFQTEGEPFESVLMPGTNERYDLMSGQTVRDVPAFLSGKAGIWVSLVSD